MRARGVALAAGLAAATVAAGPAVAQQHLQTQGNYCNDQPFNSDGAGITACMGYSLKFDDTVIAIGITGVEPEQFGNTSNSTDPLQAKARISAFYGREFAGSLGGTAFDYELAARAGIDGGAADDVGIWMRNEAHKLFGYGSKPLVSQNSTRPGGGASGWARKDMAFSMGRDFTVNFVPYAHGSLGNDTDEAGAGIMLDLQPLGAKGLSLLLPQNGAYAPVYGGDGIGVFASVRAVAYEDLYEKYTNHFLAEAGLTSQMTFFERFRAGLSASCTTPAYRTTNKPDCKMEFQSGFNWW